MRENVKPWLNRAIPEQQHIHFSEAAAKRIVCRLFAIKTSKPLYASAP
jgi:hypothetical protein